MGIIRPMTQADIPRVAEIHVLSRRTAYRGIISDSRLFAETTVIGQMSKFAERLSDSTHTTVVYDNNGILCGFMTTCPCRDSDKPNAHEVRSIYIDPPMFGHGIGAKLLAHCHVEATAQGRNEICLWVLKENHAARAFYEKIGYTHDGATKDVDSTRPAKMRYCKTLF